MPTVVYVQADGSRRAVESPAGSSVMEAAIRNNVKGIDAECGGCLSCATCHVYVEDAWSARLPAPEKDEADMLEFVAAEQQPTSRLSCQLVMTDALDGLVVRVPRTQTAT